MSEIKEKVLEFYDSILSVSDHRYKSWEHCHNYFRKIKNKEITIEERDTASLHLAFYLASWGMYRGSSFILQKDYTIYYGIVKILLDKRYLPLWDLENSSLNNKELNILFIDLYKKVEQEISKNKNDVILNHKELKNRERFSDERMSATLMTKILLGTIGCIPAYDRFFISGLKAKGLQQRFNVNTSFNMTFSFYLNNKEEIDQIMDEIYKKSNCKYSIMKIIDMYFWKIGEERDNGNEEYE